MEGTYFNQRKYTLDILKDSGMLGEKPARTPMPKGTKFSTNKSTLMTTPKRHRRLISRLLYLNLTKPDRSLLQFRQFVIVPQQDHWVVPVHILRYLKNSPSKGLFFPFNNDFSLIDY